MYTSSRSRIFVLSISRFGVPWHHVLALPSALVPLRSPPPSCSLAPGLSFSLPHTVSDTCLSPCGCSLRSGSLLPKPARYLWLVFCQPLSSFSQIFFPLLLPAFIASLSFRAFILLLPRAILLLLFWAPVSLPGPSVEPFFSLSLTFGCFPALSAFAWVSSSLRCFSSLKIFLWGSPNLLIAFLMLGGFLLFGLPNISKTILCQTMCRGMSKTKDFQKGSYWSSSIEAWRSVYSLQH